jgi:hypothetical protein
MYSLFQNYIYFTDLIRVEKLVVAQVVKKFPVLWNLNFGCCEICGLRGGEGFDAA